MDVPDSTLTGLETGREERSGLWGRRAFLCLLLVVVLAGVTGRLGVRTATASADSADYDLDVTYAAVARAGLDVPWQVTVTSRAGFQEEITLAVTGDYFDIYETQGFTPEPSASTRDADTLYLTFDAPEGTELHRRLRRLHPALRPGRARRDRLGRRRRPGADRHGVHPNHIASLRRTDVEIVVRARSFGSCGWSPERWALDAGELSTFELLLYVTMGDLVQQGVTQQDYSITAAVLAVGTFALLTVLLSWLQWRFPRCGRWSPVDRCSS